MQELYIVDVELLPPDQNDGPSTGTYDEGQLTLLHWLQHASPSAIEIGDLKYASKAPLKDGAAGSSRHATWDIARDGDNRALRVEIRDTYDDGRPDFVTRVTLASMNRATTARVSMARASSSARLIPVGAADLYQPSVLRTLAMNRNLRLSIGGQRQDGRYEQVRRPQEVQLLLQSLRNPSRLPILLAHVRTTEAMATVKKSAAGLIGMCSVVSVSLPVIRQLASELPGHAPTAGGASLVWSDLHATPIRLGSEVVNSGDPDALRKTLMRPLAPLSVLSRGSETKFSQIRRDETRVKERRAAEASLAAHARGDMAAENAALHAQLRAALESLTEWQELAAYEEQRANELQAEAEESSRLRAQVEQLSVALSASPAPSAASESEDASWDDLPRLKSANADSAVAFFNALEDLTDNKIVFSDHAAQSWKKSGSSQMRV